MTDAMTDNALTLIAPGELITLGEGVRMIDMMATEIDRLRRENALLRKELHRYLVLDIQRTWLEMSDEEAEEQAEKEITWMVLHNEGAE